MPAFAWTPERHGPKAPNSVCVHTGHTSNAARLLPGRCHGGGSGAKSMQSLLPNKVTKRNKQRNTTKHKETQRNNMKQNKQSNQNKSKQKKTKHKYTPKRNKTPPKTIQNITAHNQNSATKNNLKKQSERVLSWTILGVFLIAGRPLL
jgi:hypothetical protein